ncbi:hypothetical protein [Acetobacter persici]|uniref:hypothetical protein n=1 Tax=Acetobacter persici TaxID=1076596 RepID=UPI001F3B545F|nr:hypothetical protein [Acetobacter persici]MCG0998692.1 hypothetical protein [Acetobacter persici]
MLEIQGRSEKSCKMVLRKLELLRIVPWIVPKGGFCLWCQLPKVQDSTDSALKSMADAILHTLGNTFSVSQSACSFMWFNVTQQEDKNFSLSEKILEGEMPDYS